MRTTARTTARTPVAVAAVLGLAVLGGACSGSKQAKAPPTTARTTTTATAPPSSGPATSVTPTTAPPSTSSTVPAGDVSIAVWPLATSALRFSDPVAATRSFVTAYLQMVSPSVGAFRAGDARSGEVPVQPGARGPTTTVLLRRLGADASWWVIGASTPNIVLREPAVLATITSPVALRGTSTAFEATVDVSVRADGAASPLAQTFVMGGANGVMGPFAAAVAFRAPVARLGAVVLFTRSSETGNVAEATVVRVRFAGA